MTRMVGVATFFCLLCALVSCTSQDSLLQVKEAIAADALVVDTRSKEEFNGGHIDGAVLIPHDQMESRYKELLSHKNKSVVLYCRSGRRSGIAKEILEKEGFTRVINAGGYRRLKDVLSKE